MQLQNKVARNKSWFTISNWTRSFNFEAGHVKKAVHVLTDMMLLLRTTLLNIVVNIIYCGIYSYISFFFQKSNELDNIQSTWTKDSKGQTERFLHIIL